MKQLESESSGATWSNDLASQLGFIKKYLRYPIGRKTLWPVLMLVAMLPAIGFVAYSVLSSKSDGRQRPEWFPLMIIGMILVPCLLVARRYIRVLRFTAVPARRSLAENMELLQQFLHAHHFAIGRHPQMPEVFQIISRSIGGSKDQREVVILIADDNRILINSHFTQNPLKAPMGKTHDHQIVQILSAFIRASASRQETELTVRGDTY